MDRLGSADILFFEGFRLDRAGGGLFRLDPEGIAEPVAMSSRALDLLGLLVEWHEELVSKDVIMDAVWPKTIVEEANLTVHISTLRRILDQNCDNGSCIQTMPGRGYRFIGAVTRAEPTSPPLPVRPSGNGSGPIAGNGESRDVVTPDQTDGIAQQRTSQMRLRFWRGVVVAATGALVLVAAVAVGIWYSPGPSTRTARRACRSS
jgi:DNA-binding winged helix-turn-helix (wHTH) protein